ncbi:MAG: MBL fold metallo-hydrolase [Pirellulaceae bacterium]
MPTSFHSADIRGQFVFLGTGTSVGVPTMGCGCSVCLSTNPRNKRLRASAIVGLPEGNLLIDTTPDLRTQFLREGLGWPTRSSIRTSMPTICSAWMTCDYLLITLTDLCRCTASRMLNGRIRHSYDYAFSNGPQTHSGAVPRLEIRTIGLEPFDVLGSLVHPVRLLHGPNYQVLGFRIGNIAYCTDTNFIPEESYHVLAGVEILILDALRREPHATHFHLDGALEAIARMRRARALLTHISHDLEYEQTNRVLPAGGARLRRPTAPSEANVARWPPS